MYKIGICLSIVAALSACSSSGSSDSSTDTTGGGTTSGTAGTTDVGTTTVAVGGDTSGVTAGTTAGTTTGTTTGDTTAGTGGSSTAGTSQFGFIGIDTFDDEVTVDATFFSIPNSVPFATASSQFLPTSDDCEVVDYSDLGGILLGDFDEIDGQELTSLSAGDVITVRSAAGSYTELLKIEFGGYIAYSSDPESVLTAPAPANLLADIPGEQFPAFTGVALPNAAQIQMSSPGLDDQITASTTYSWTASGNANSFLDISVDGTGSSASLSVECTVIDDGSFTFPPSIQAEMGAFTGDGDESRVSINVIQQNNVALFLASITERTN